jgi:tetratricopeptide (TPR) repeat protein
VLGFKGIRSDSYQLYRWAGVAFLCCPFLGAGQSGINTPPTSSELRAANDLSPAIKPPVRPLTPESRGDIYLARKMYRDAIEIYGKAPASARVENKIGIAFHQMADLSLARKHYERSIRMDRNFADAINNLGTVHYASRDYRDAIHYFKRSLKCSGPVASVYANLGAAYFARRDYRNSSRYFEQAMKLDPDVLEHRTGFGTLIQEGSMTDIALFHLYLAKTYAKAGSNDRALTYLRKALEEGLKERKKLAEIPEFSVLRTKPEFVNLLLENPRPL